VEHTYYGDQPGSVPPYGMYGAYGHDGHDLQPHGLSDHDMQTYHSDPHGVQVEEPVAH